MNKKEATIIFTAAILLLGVFLFYRYLITDIEMHPLKLNIGYLSTEGQVAKLVKERNLVLGIIGGVGVLSYIFADKIKK